MKSAQERLEVIQGDITTLAVDAIVNAAKRTLLGGGGVDGAIHRAAGPDLLTECRTLGGADTGEAKITRGYRLPARYVIHAVGPMWKGGDDDEDRLLASCYRNSLARLVENRLSSIAFPAISTGIYGFPIERATRIAVTTTCDVLDRQPGIESVVFCCFSARDLEIYRQTIGDMRTARRLSTVAGDHEEA